MINFIPFANEHDCLSLAELTIENRVDRLEIYGALQITKDRAGLRLAKRLKEVLDDTVAALEQADLPEQLPAAKIERIKNPFD